MCPKHRHIWCWQQHCTSRTTNCGNPFVATSASPPTKALDKQTKHPKMKLLRHTGRKALLLLLPLGALKLKIKRQRDDQGQPHTNSKSCHCSRRKVPLKNTLARCLSVLVQFFWRTADTRILLWLGGVSGARCSVMSSHYAGLR